MSISSDNYEVLTPLPGESVKVRFEGTYKGASVVWNLQLYTIDKYFGEVAGQANIVKPNDPIKTPRQFIHIVENDDGEHAITVAVAVPQIDEPSLKKVIIMLRNYKRLRPGWHTWGQVYEVQ